MGLPPGVPGEDRRSGPLEATLGDPAIDAVGADLEREIAELCREAGSVGASVGIVRDRELVWSLGFGYADIEAKRRPDEHTVFRIASVTKTFTATALFQLRDEGRLSLDDPLTAHIPEFASATARVGSLDDVTVRRLLCHRSGLMCEPPTGEPYWETMRNPTMGQVLDSLSRVEVVVEPDTAFKYSNLGFTLLGEVIARVSGRPYTEYVEDEVLRPVGMDSTRFEMSGEMAARQAVGYETGQDGREPEEAPHPHMKGMAAAGQLYSTVSDLGRWLALQFRTEAPGREGRQVLPGRSLREMHRPLFLEPDWSMGYGLPWMSTRMVDRVLTGHTGHLFGFRADVSFNAESRLGVVALFNTSTLPPVRQRVYRTALAADEAMPLEAERPGPSEPPDRWRDHVGLYDARLGLTMSVDYRRPNLEVSIAVGSSLGFAPGVVRATDRDDVFTATEGRWIGEAVTFVRSDGGSVAGFDLGPFRFRRLPEAG